MHKEVIIQVFEKAKAELIKNSGVEPSDAKCAKYLSDIVSEINEFAYGERSLRDLYKEAIKKDDIKIKQPQVVNALCNYLGYKNYQDLIIKNPYLSKTNLPKNFREQFIFFLKNNKIVLFICGITIIIVFVIILINRQRWMIWKDDHYIEVSFDIKKYDLNQLKVFKKERIKYFKQVLPDCETNFFSKDGSVNLWYSKNVEGELEYFTALGLHPNTGKTLKPISDYMIDKYICKN